MTPLLGTKTPSAPVGGKSGGDRRAARSLLSCALWRGMGRLWRGMGGMGRPEPLSAHRPHQQQGLSGFHETRNPRHGYSLPRGVSQREFRGFHETRITKHESRLLCFSRDTKHGLYRRAVRRGCEWFAQPTAAARTAAPVTQSPFSCSLLFAIVRYCSLKNIARSQCSRTVRRSRSASLQVPLAGESRKSVQNPGSPGESTRRTVRCSSLRLPARSAASNTQ